MTAQYDADLMVSAELARQLILDQFPDIRPSAVVAFGEGWDNWIYQVDEWLFRFPRRGIAAPLTEREMAVLPRLAPRLPGSIPHPVFFGQPTVRYPWPFFGYRAIAGMPVADVSLDAAKRSASARALAEFLCALQRVPAAEAREWGAGPPTLGRMDLAKLRDRFETWLSSAVDRGLAHSDAPWAEEFRAAEALALSLERPVLVHGDLNFKNVLLDSQGHLAGIVDWGDLHLGHPAEDWMFAAGYFPREGQEVFRTLVGASDELWRVARAVSIYVNLIILVSAGDMGRPADVAEAQWQLSNLVATQEA